MHITTAREALQPLRSGQRIYLHGGAATPTPLLEALAERARDLEGLETVSLHLEGPAPHVDPAWWSTSRDRRCAECRYIIL
ncbi:MAG: hypothetical protein WEA81_05960 [Dehalococcoidia bacterium]